MDALSEVSSDTRSSDLELKVRTNNPQVLAAGFDETQLPGSGVTAYCPLSLSELLARGPAASGRHQLRLSRRCPCQARLLVLVASVSSVSRLWDKTGPFSPSYFR